jgi:hypothetical protein
MSESDPADPSNSTRHSGVGARPPRRAGVHTAAAAYSCSASSRERCQRQQTRCHLLPGSGQRRRKWTMRPRSSTDRGAGAPARRPTRALLQLALLIAFATVGAEGFGKAFEEAKAKMGKMGKGGGTTERRAPHGAAHRGKPGNTLLYLAMNEVQDEYYDKNPVKFYNGLDENSDSKITGIGAHTLAPNRPACPVATA